MFTTGTAKVDIRLPGQWYQAEAAGSGLNQNHHRDYDPSLGRYIQVDPLGIDAGQNPYAYVDGKPYDMVDPEGLEIVVVNQRGRRDDNNAEWRSARQKLIQVPATRKLIERLEASKNTYRILLTNGLNAETRGKNVSWDPKAYFFPKGCGGYISPFVILGHELAHLEGNWLDLIKPDSQYDNKEERRAIEQYEHPVAKHYGQPLRRDHKSGAFGRLY